MRGFNKPVKINTERIKILMICEALPVNKSDYFYESTNSLYVTNTIEAFNNGEIRVKSIDDIIKKGVYLTSAVKAVREGITVSTEKIHEHSFLLENELKLFPNLKVILLMGDTAIKALNYISMRTEGKKAVPSGSTYKIRKGKFYFRKIRVFPSYLQTGKNFLIEKSKRKMVAEDIRNAFKVIRDS